MARPGSGGSSAQREIILRRANGDEVRLPLYRKSGSKPPSATNPMGAGSFSGTWENGSSVPMRDVPRRVRMLGRGAGWSSRPGSLEQGEEWDGYADGRNICTRFGYIIPAGEQTAWSGIDPAWGQITDLVSWNGDLWLICTNQIARIPNGSEPVAAVYANAGDLFTNAVVFNDTLCVACLCTHTGGGAGTGHSYVTIADDGAGGYTTTHPDATYAGGPPPVARWLDTVYWEHEGTGGFRLVAKASDYHLRYTIVDTGDFYAAASWGPSVLIGDNSYEIRRFVASRDTVWVAKQDGIWAVNDANAAAGGMNLTPYWRNQLDPDAAVVVGYWQGKVVAAHSLGIDLIDVNSWQVANQPTPIHISYGRPNETTLNGRYTAFCSDGAWLVAAVRNSARDSLVLYGAPRQRESPAAGVTLMDWFGPEVNVDGEDVTAMVVHTAAEGAQASGLPALWVAAFDTAADGSFVPSLRRVSLFQGDTPLADYKLGGGHRFAGTAEITLTDEHWAVRAARKGALRGSLGKRAIANGGRVELYVAVDGGDFPHDPQVIVDDEVASADFRLPGLVGHVVRAKLVLVSWPTLPTVVDELELRANLALPLRDHAGCTVELSTLSAADSDLPNREDVPETLALLRAMAESAEDLTLVGWDEVTRTVVLDNVAAFSEQERSDQEGHVTLLTLGWTVVG